MGGENCEPGTFAGNRIDGVLLRPGVGAGKVKSGRELSEDEAGVGGPFDVLPGERNVRLTLLYSRSLSDPPKWHELER